MNMIKKLIPSLNKKSGLLWNVRVYVYKTHIVPIFLYGSEVWHQGKGADEILKGAYYNIFKNCKPATRQGLRNIKAPWTPEQFIWKQKARANFKIMGGMSPLDKNKYLDERQDNHEQVSRAKINKNTAKQKMTQNVWEIIAFKHRMRDLWDAVPIEIKDSPLKDQMAWLRKHWLLNPKHCPSELEREDLINGRWQFKALSRQLKIAGYRNLKIKPIIDNSNAQGRLTLTDDTLKALAQARKIAKRK